MNCSESYQNNADALVEAILLNIQFAEDYQEPFFVVSNDSFKKNKHYDEYLHQLINHYANNQLINGKYHPKQFKFQVSIIYTYIHTLIYKLICIICSIVTSGSQSLENESNQNIQ